MTAAGSMARDLPHRLDAVLLRHDDIDDGDRRPVLAEQAHALAAVGGLEDGVALGLEGEAEDLADLGRVVDEEEMLVSTYRYGA